MLFQFSLFLSFFSLCNFVKIDIFFLFLSLKVSLRMSKKWIKKRFCSFFYQKFFLFLYFQDPILSYQWYFYKADYLLSCLWTWIYCFSCLCVFDQNYLSLLFQIFISFMYGTVLSLLICGKKGDKIEN